jgi:glutamate-5-semialdehyde dehydrogenase
MTELNTVEHVLALGQQAKKASALMAKASAATKNKALRHLAALLRENTDALQLDNAKDLERARAAAWPNPWWTV